MNTKYIINPVNFATIKEKLDRKQFRCTEEFVNEAKWILHNACIICTGTPNRKEVVVSKTILKICKQEANEIDTCPECYLNANSRSDWFIDVCSQPHLLLWAKLKGFPYWPAKSMGLGQGSLVNVRFFGEHDRSFVSVKDCYLLSEMDPNINKAGKRTAQSLADCFNEVKQHIQRIKEKVGDFKYAAFKTLYDPNEEIQQLEAMMPGVAEYMRKHAGLFGEDHNYGNPPLQYKIVKTANNHLSIIKKPSSSTHESGNDSDNSQSPAKKKESCCASPESSNKVKHSCSSSSSSSTKYEVITKSNSEEKIGTVILKRKADTEAPAAVTTAAASNKHHKQEAVLMPYPKLTKLEPDVFSTDAQREQDTEQSQSNGSNKRKIAQVEQLKSKDNDSTGIVKQKAKQPKLVEETTDAVRNGNEQLLARSDRLCVRVKRNSNIGESKLPVSASELNKTATNASTTAAAAGKNERSVGTQMSKSSSNKDKVNNILKDLVPFVEIKTEVVSDNETEQANTAEPNAKTESQVTSETPANILPSLVTATAQLLPKKPIINHSPMPEVINIKREVLSDGEDCQLQTCSKTAAIDNQSIRVVGDTTIQRISTPKPYQNSHNNLQQTASAQTQSSSANVSSSLSSYQQQTHKRSSLRGVPHGPLPASAAPSSISQSNHSIKSNLSNRASSPHALPANSPEPRARKSFPNPPVMELMGNAREMLACNTNTATAATMTDNKRSNLLNNSMVSIPVDIATNRINIQQQNSANISHSAANCNIVNNNNYSSSLSNNIPIPPLTAVSKTISLPAVNTKANGNADFITGSMLGQPTLMSSSYTNNTGPPPLAGLSINSSSINNLPLATANSQATLLSNANMPPDDLTQAAFSFSQPLEAADNISHTHLLGSSVTPTLASAIAEIICKGPPKMIQRPNGPLQSTGTPMYPSQAGPVCKKLVENAHKLTDFFISVMEDTMAEVSAGEEPNLSAKLTMLTLELERTRQAHELEVAELKRTSDLMLCEMRKTMENEKNRISNDIRKQCELERLRSVEETKKKQWCANCWREAQFYCCWNTSYCDYPCQQLHWSRHAPMCAQTRSNLVEADASLNKNERHHAGSKSTSPAAGNNLHFNATKSSNNSAVSKKDKQQTHSASQLSIGTNATTTTAASKQQQQLPTSEVLKLPNNTFLRPLSTTANNSMNNSTRVVPSPKHIGQPPFTTVPMPIQRFNIPLPIAAPVNTNPPYTIVQRGKTWELMGTTPVNKVLNSSSYSPQQTQQQSQSNASSLQTRMSTSLSSNSSNMKASNTSSRSRTNAGNNHLRSANSANPL